MGEHEVVGGKGTTTAAGMHVPLIANWKGVTPAGRVLKDLVDFSDFYATFADLAEALYERLEGKVLVAHNARFDYGFLRSEFRRLGRRFRALFCDFRLWRRGYGASRQRRRCQPQPTHAVPSRT